MGNASKLAQKRKLEEKKAPSSKRQHTESARAEKKRSRPITDNRPPSREESDEDDYEEVPGDEDQWTDEDDDNMDVDAAEESEKLAQPKNPNGAPPPSSFSACLELSTAARESHQAQKLLHEQRKAAKPHSDLLVESKRVWSQLCRKNLSTTERQKHVKDLMKIIRGKVKDIVFKHDASRIVQTVVKYGSTKERDEIAAELKGKFKELSQNKYSKVCRSTTCSTLSDCLEVPRLQAHPPQLCAPPIYPDGTPTTCSPSPPTSGSHLRSGRRLRALR